MFCPQCGKQHPDSARFCMKCGTALLMPERDVVVTDTAPAGDAGAPVETESAVTDAVTEPMPPAEDVTVVMTRPARRPRRRLLAAVIAGLLVLAVGGYFAYQHYFATPLSALIPQHYSGFALVDAGWAWKSTADLRAQDAVRDSLKEMEDEFGISIDQDVAPWIGQVAFAYDTVKNGDPRGTLFLQIRNKIAFARSIGRLRAAATRQGDVQWVSERYRGIEVLRAKAKDDSATHTTPVATAVYGGWLVVGFGNGVIEEAIDVRTGHREPINNNASWQKVLKQLPNRPVLLFGVNGDAVARAVHAFDEDAYDVMRKVDLDTYTAAVALSEHGNTLRCDLINATASAEAANFWKDIRQRVGTVNSDSLAQLPDSAFVALLAQRPDQWIAIAREFAERADSSERDDIDSTYREIEPLVNTVGRCADGFGAGATWDDRNGFGFVTVGKTAADRDANDVAESLRRFLEDQDYKVDRTGALYTLPESRSDDGMAKSLVGWQAKDRWVRFSSHTDWLSAPTRTSFSLPGEASKASLVLMGNFAFIPSFMHTLKDISWGPDLSRVLENLRIDKSSWYAYLVLDPRGQTQRVTLQLRNWNWREVVMAFVREQGSSRRNDGGGSVLPFGIPSRQRAQQQASTNNLRQMAMAVSMYVAENEECFPPMGSLRELQSAIGNALPESVFRHPRSGGSYQVNANLSGLCLGQMMAPDKTILVYEEVSPWSDGSHIAAFVDGHVERIGREDWHPGRLTVERDQGTRDYTLEE